MRLDKFLADCGIGSRKEIKQILREGNVCVNSAPVLKPEYKVNPEKDTVTLNGEEVIYRKFIYLMLNKPQGYVSAVFDKKLPTVAELVPEKYRHFEVFPVGRLDIDTEGLLVLTNDGALTHRVISPKSHVDKTYYVETESPVKEEYAGAFREGVVLDDGYKTMPAIITAGNNPKSCTLIIQEGKFHQVKRMMEAVGNKVTYLKRIRMGALPLDESLKPGEIRELTDKEIIMLEEKSTWI